MAVRAHGIYRQRRPRSSGLWQVLDTCFEEFQDVYEERFESKYGSLRPVVIKRVEEYLKCGILDFGFARVRCPQCRHEYLVAFSCKARGFCPSCQAKRQAEFSAFLTEEVLESVPHRQVVLSVPRRLRPFFMRSRRLLAKMARCGYDTVRDLISEAIDTDETVPGAVVSVQTFGSLLDFHPHLHILTSWGGFDTAGRFRQVREIPSQETVSRLFRHKILKMLLREHAITQDIVDNMLSWKHTGFGADIGKDLVPDVSEDHTSRTPQDALLEYMVRAPVAVSRITQGANDKIIYKADHIHPRHGGNFRFFDPLDFIAQIVLHIPNVHEKSVIYYGWYSNRSRGLRKKQEQENTSAGKTAQPSESQAPLEIRWAWAAMIKRVYEVDPLTCPECGAEMYIVSFIDNEDVIFRILKHLDFLGKDPEQKEIHVRGSPQQAKSRSA